MSAGSNDASAASSTSTTDDVLTNIETIRSLAQCGSLLSRPQVEKLGKTEVIDYLFKRDTLSAAL